MVWGYEFAAIAIAAIHPVAGRKFDTGGFECSNFLGRHVACNCCQRYGYLAAARREQLLVLGGLHKMFFGAIEAVPVLAFVGYHVSRSKVIGAVRASKFLRHIFERFCLPLRVGNRWAWLICRVFVQAVIRYEHVGDAASDLVLDEVGAEL
jgi:hypothetical protein